MDAIRATFFEECVELLEQLEAGLLALEAGTDDPDTIDSVFRAVHSIKGGAGAFELGDLVHFSHDFETALDSLRSGRIDREPDVIATLLRSSDRLVDLVSAARSGTASAEVDLPELTALLARLAEAAPADEADDDFAPVLIDLSLDPELLSDDAEDEAEPQTEDQKRPRTAWNIEFEPLPELLVSGNEPLYLFRAIEVLGQIEVEARDTDLPDLVDMDPSVPRLRWYIQLIPTAPDLTETEIESIFEFTTDLSVLNISSHELEDDVESEEDAPSENDPSEEGFSETEVVSGDSNEASPNTGPSPSTGPTAATDASTPLAAPPGTKDAPRPAAASNSEASSGGSQPTMATIRVNLSRIDRLVNLVGELVISQSMLAQGMMRAGLDQHSEAVSTLDELQQLTRDMQDSVMAIRAQPVKPLFQRMTRIVREAAQATGKDVRMATDGEGTEIDKTVVERLADPLTHMIRNAIDHGIETPADRIAAGKPEAGTVKLSARQQSDRVVIEVSDDGRGVDRAKVLERAVSRGLVPEGKVLDTSEIDRLLFMPGFSTNTEVSALSGRGVGMDVVQRGIRDLNGTISISSTEGKGCTISISLPLTLAILDGMIVRSARQRMVIPLSAIVETQTLTAARIETLGPDQDVVQLHDRFVPLVDLASGMGFSPATMADEPDEDTALLFVQADENGPFALRVDAIEAQRQVVIKGLGENFGHVPCVSAATILGDGQVALIVDPAGIAVTSGLQRVPTPPVPNEGYLQ